MIHPQSPSERRVRFDNNVMFLAEGGDFSPSVERMYLDLVDDWLQSRFRYEKLFQLERGREK